VQFAENRSRYGVEKHEDVLRVIEQRKAADERKLAEERKATARRLAGSKRSSRKLLRFDLFFSVERLNSASMTRRFRASLSFDDQLTILAFPERIANRRIGASIDEALVSGLKSCGGLPTVRVPSSAPANS